LWYGRASVNGTDYSQVGKLAADLSSSFTATPNGWVYAAAPNGSGGFNAVTDTGFPSTAQFHAVSYDASGTLTWDKIVTPNNWAGSVGCIVEPQTMTLFAPTFTANFQRVYGFQTWGGDGTLQTNFLDSPTVGGTADRQLCIDHDAQGNLYVGSGQGNFCAVSKYTANGDLIWTAPIGGSPSSGPLPGWPPTQPVAITYSARGDVVVAINGLDPAETFGIAKLDPQTGKPIFDRLVGKGSGSLYSVNAIREDSKGNLIVRGTSIANNWTVENEFLAKFDGATAATLWRRDFPNLFAPNRDYWTGSLHTLALDGGDNVLLCSMAQSAGAPMLVTTKLTSTGATVFSHSISVGSASAQQVWLAAPGESSAVTCDGSGNAYVMGSIANTVQVVAYDEAGNLLRQSSFTLANFYPVAPWATIDYNAKRAAITVIATLRGAAWQNLPYNFTFQLNAATFAQNWWRGADYRVPSQATDAALDTYGNLVTVGPGWIRKQRADTGAVVYSTYYSKIGIWASVTIGPDFYPVLCGSGASRFGRQGGDMGWRGWDGFLAKFRG